MKVFNWNEFISPCSGIVICYNEENSILEVRFCFNGIVEFPQSVICICGVNKLVANIDEAIKRVKTKAAPPNTVRRGIETPCAKSGECISLKKENPEMCEGCHGSGRICCNYVVCAQQRHVNRIKVIIIGEEYGY